MAVLADVLAVAHQEIMENIPDILAQTNGLLNRIIKKQKFQLKGGNQTIQFPVAVYENTAQGWISGTTDVQNINPTQNFVYGELQYKYFYSTVAIPLQDFSATVDSPNATANLVIQKKNMAISTFTRTMSAAMYASGTASNQQINGFADIFAASGTAYGGLNNTTYANWLTEIDSTTTVVSYQAINGMLATLNERTNQQPLESTSNSQIVDRYDLDLMVSRGAIQARYESQLQVQQRFMDADLVKSGFKGIEVNGIPWVVDYYSPSNYLYIVSSSSMHFGGRYGFGISTKSPLDNDQVLPNQPIAVSTRYHVGNLYCENRRVNGVFTGLTS